MFLFRPHRGGLAEAMEAREYLQDRAALVEKITREIAQFGKVVTDADIKVNPYGYDERIDWDTFIVEVRGYGVFGFTKGPVE